MHIAPRNLPRVNRFRMAAKPQMVAISSKAKSQTAAAGNIFDRKGRRSVTLGKRMRTYAVRQPTAMIDAHENFGDRICRTDFFVNSTNSLSESSIN